MNTSGHESTDQRSNPADLRAGLWELCRTFLKLGVIGFGGPAAHVALMRQEVVVCKKWLSDQTFVDLLAATNVIPGPNSTEMAIHIGALKWGWRGMLAAGICFILPAALIATCLAWFYLEFGRLPEVDGMLRGVKPVIIVVVFQALWGLGRAVLTRPAMIATAGTAATLTALGLHELAVLFGSGVVLALWGMMAGARQNPRLYAALPVPALLLAAPTSITTFTLGGMFWTFFKIGSVLFGSGYVLLAYLRADFVERHGWLSEAQLLDAVALGQALPGPIFTTATFIGCLLGGLPGGAVATVGIFLPSFLFVVLSHRIVSASRRHPVLGAFLDGLNAASLALMAVVTAALARVAVVDFPSAVISLSAAAAILWWRVQPGWVLAGGAAAGLLLRVLAEEWR